MVLRLFFQRLRKGLWVPVSRSPSLAHSDFDEDASVSRRLPDDVQEGCFTVFAVKGEETERFVIDMDNLTNPAFLSLLEKAREEYGFQQKGALSLPCRPQDLQKILTTRKENDASNDLGLHVLLPY